MAEKWHLMPQYLPADGQTVWIRRTVPLAAPMLATWDEAVLEFSGTSAWTWDVGLNKFLPSAVPVVLEWIDVERWRHQ